MTSFFYHKLLFEQNNNKTIQHKELRLNNFLSIMKFLFKFRMSKNTEAFYHCVLNLPLLLGV